MASVTDAVRVGRPPKLDDVGPHTKERLLLAAIASFVERGFEATTLADIAGRADVSTPAVYNHFTSKVELLVEAGRFALEGLIPEAVAARSPAEVARAFLADDFADSRRLLTELHLAAQRHREVAELLDAWHADHARRWRKRSVGNRPGATVKVFFALLLGLCQIDSLSSLAVADQTLSARVDDLIRELFPDEESR